MLQSELYPDEQCCSLQVHCRVQQNFWKWRNWSKQFSMCGSDVQHTVNAITAYLTWIGLARGQTSTSLKQCGTMLMDNGTMSFKKSGDLFWRAQAVLKKKGGPTKSGLSSLLELFKLFKIIAAPFSHFPTKI